MNLLEKSLARRHGGTEGTEVGANAVRRACYHSVLFLFVCFLVFGCSMDEEEPNFTLEGVWIGYGDSYTITANSVHYAMDDSEWEGVVYPGVELIGDIEKIEKFSDNAGVIIIKITEATTGNTVNKFTGIYYRDGNKSSVKMSTAIGPAPEYGPVETETLSAASSLFTVDNAQTHVTVWGLYTR